jgi:hypothetical protein
LVAQNARKICFCRFRDIEFRIRIYKNIRLRIALWGYAPRLRGRISAAGSPANAAEMRSPT